MKHTKISNLLVVVLALSIGAGGCNPRPKGPTPIISRTGKIGGEDNTSGIEKTGPLTAPGEGPGVTGKNLGDVVPQEVRFDPSMMNQDAGRFAANTVYFDFDRATIKPSEASKIDGVVKYLQGNPTHAVQIEGHCDERGTEQYNLSLGERRALAVREYLVTAGIQPERVFTISYGEARPAETGHNEAAWSRNRRGVFVLLTPK